MRRILLVMSVAALTAAMVLVTAVPAFATIHELSRAGEQKSDEASPIAGNYPPGVSDGDEGNEILSQFDPDFIPAVQGNGSDNSDKLNSEGPLEGCPNPDTGKFRASCTGNFAQPTLSVGGR